MGWNCGEDLLFEDAVFAHSAQTPVKNLGSQAVLMPKNFAGSLRSFRQFAQDANGPLATKELDYSVECKFLVHVLLILYQLMVTKKSV